MVSTDSASGCTSTRQRGSGRSVPAASDVPGGVTSSDYPSRVPRFSTNNVQLRRVSPREIGPHGQ